MSSICMLHSRRCLGRFVLMLCRQGGCLLEMGWSEKSADLMLEMYSAMEKGLVAPEGTPYQTMTTLRRFTRMKLRKHEKAQG